MKNNLSSLVLGSALAAVFASGAIADGEAPVTKINDFAATVPPAPTAEEAAASPAAPRVLKWKDGKKAVFCLSFDDGCNSQLENAIPRLQKYGAVGTFYIIYGGGHFPWSRKRWEALADDPCVVFGNHTWHHKDVGSVEELETELTGADKIIHELTPGKPWPRLVSYGQPGGVKWTVTTEEIKAALPAHNLIDRAPFLGAAINVKTVPEAEALVEKAIERGGFGHLDFHGVGGDWLAASNEFLDGLLECMARNRDILWNPAEIDYQKYRLERDASTVSTTKSDAREVRVRLETNLDPALYDYPLTIEAVVPADWTACTVQKFGSNEKPLTLKAVGGRVRFYALPGEYMLVRK